MRVVYYNTPYFIDDKELFVTSGNMNFVLASGNMITLPTDKMFSVYNPRDGASNNVLYFREENGTKFTYDKTLINRRIYIEIGNKYKLFNVLGEIITYDTVTKDIITIFSPPYKNLYYVVYDPTYETCGYNIDLKVYKTESHVVLVKAVLKNFEGVLLGGYKLNFYTDKGTLYQNYVITDEYGRAFNMVYIDNLDDMPTVNILMYK